MSAAFFDLDNTLVRGSSLFHVGRILVRRGVVSRRDLLRFTCAEWRYVSTRTEISGGAQGLADRLLHLVAGYPVEDLRTMCSDAVGEILDRMSVPLVVAHVRAHRNEGRPTYLVTASPREIAVPIAAALDMTGVVATELEEHDGIYTGHLRAPVVHGPRKAAEVSVLTARLGIALSECYMYSDSVNDLPLLRQVRFPVVVNGNRAMRALAYRNHWAYLDTNRPRRTSWPYQRDSAIHRHAADLAATQYT